MAYEISPYEFTDEDLEAQPAWFFDKIHFTLELQYLGIFAAPYQSDIVGHGTQWGAETISVPGSKGMLWRAYKNLIILTSPIPVTSQDEYKEREAKFRENVIALMRDFDKVWDGYKSELLALYKPLKELNFEKATNVELINKWLELRDACYRMSEIHFYMMYGVFHTYVLFGELCKELFGIDSSSREFTKMVSGFDNKSFESERELWRLSRRALELGLGDAFQRKSDEVAPKLRESENGRKWLGELDEYLDEYGWRCLICWLPSTPSWRDDPCYVIEKIKNYLTLAEFSQPETLKRQAEERERVLREFSPRVPEDKKELFNLLLTGAQHASMFSEEHDLYCEMQTDGLLRHYLLEFGRRFTEAGSIDKQNDIFNLGFDEITKMGICPERYRMQSLIEKRRAMQTEFLKEELPIAISKTMSEMESVNWLSKIADPLITHVIVGELPKPKPELKADLVGAPGAPGIAEGRARVVTQEHQLTEVQPGEILVCPTTTISWTPIFAVVKGVVTDRGGTLSHAAIVSREYGIPCIVNTLVGSFTIKPGQRIRIDGGEGAVYILGK